MHGTTSPLKALHRVYPGGTLSLAARHRSAYGSMTPGPVPQAYGSMTPGPVPQVYGSAGAVHPLPEGRLTSPYGHRIHPILGTSQDHSGADIAASEGVPIRATAGGRVVRSKMDDAKVVRGELRPEGWNGNYVIIKHDPPLPGGIIATAYSHMSRRAVRAGQRVEPGEVIGYVGSTGMATGPHLHWMAYKKGWKHTDPMTLLEEPEVLASSGGYLRTMGPTRDDIFGAAHPVPGARLTSGYASRIHPVTKKRQGHSGADLAAPEGTPIYAVADGVVSKSEMDGATTTTNRDGETINLPQGWDGHHVIIKHNPPLSGGIIATSYSHMSRRAVKAGDRVREGDVIGYVGETGMATGPHLHFMAYKSSGGSWKHTDPSILLQGASSASRGAPAPASPRPSRSQSAARRPSYRPTSVPPPQADGGGGGAMIGLLALAALAAASLS